MQMLAGSLDNGVGSGGASAKTSMALRNLLCCIFFICYFKCQMN